MSGVCKNTEFHLTREHMKLAVECFMGVSLLQLDGWAIQRTAPESLKLFSILKVCGNGIASFPLVLVRSNILLLEMLLCSRNVEVRHSNGGEENLAFCKLSQPFYPFKHHWNDCSDFMGILIFTLFTERKGQSILLRKNKRPL